MAMAPPTPAEARSPGVSAVQRAYLYLVALIAIHMIVLGLANVLRVGAELMLGAASGGFTGLPFLFAEGRAAPRQLYREQISLAIALLLVGVPAWLLHWSVAQRAARQSSSAELNAPLRASYLYVVVFVTTLLMFFYTQNALFRALAAAVGPPEFFTRFPAVENEPRVIAARIAGALAMVFAAGLVWSYHSAVAWSDRQAVHLAGGAASLRRLQLYLLAAIGLLVTLTSAAGLLSALWMSLDGTRSDLRFVVVSSVPPLVSGLALWLYHWAHAQRVARSDSAYGLDERRSAVRKLALYGIVLISAIVTMIASSLVLSAVVRRALFGTPMSDPSRFGPIPGTLWSEIQAPLAFAFIFGLAWAFHWRAVEREALLQAEAARQATVRRIYNYLLAALALLFIGIGAAGVLGVIGSYVVGHQTHRPEEISAYITLLLVGLPVWAFHWILAQRRIWMAARTGADPPGAVLAHEERRALPRRLFLYLAVFGGVVAVLIFGATALFRVINIILGQPLDRVAAHDLWHLVADAGVGAGTLAWHWRTLRADRDAVEKGEVAVSAPRTPLVFVVRGAEASTARRRITEVVPHSAEISVYEADDQTVADVVRRLTSSGKSEHEPLMRAEREGS
jgi:hypothetical protein